MRKGQETYKKILVPMALNHGIGMIELEVARELLAEDGEITAIHIFEMPSGSSLAFPDEGSLQAATKTTGDRLRERVADQPDVKPVLLHGHSSRSIIDYATENNFDCIVIGSHEPSLTDYLLGSTASRVVRHAPCAVHVLRGAV